MQITLYDRLLNHKKCLYPQCKHSFDHETLEAHDLFKSPEKNKKKPKRHFVKATNANASRAPSLLFFFSS